MQAAGGIAAGLDADRAAAALLAGIQGGVTILLATGGITHLEAALDTGLDQLRDGHRQGGEAAVDEGRVPGRLGGQGQLG
jgi:hypothetical protein